MIHLIIIFVAIVVSLTISFGFLLFFIRMLISLHPNLLYMGIVALTVGCIIAVLVSFVSIFYSIYLIEYISTVVFMLNIPLFFAYSIKLWLNRNLYFPTKKHNLRLLNSIHFFSSLLVFGFYVYIGLIKMGM